MIALLSILIDLIVAWVVMLIWPALIEYTGVQAFPTISFGGAIVLVIFVRFLTLDTRVSP